MGHQGLGHWVSPTKISEIEINRAAPHGAASVAGDVRSERQLGKVSIAVRSVRHSYAFILRSSPARANKRGDIRLRKTAIAILASALVSAPAGAAPFDDGTAGVRPGTIAGAVIRIPLDRSRTARPRASLAFAPTQTRIAANGATSTRISEGFAINLARGSKPTLSLAGARLDRVLRLNKGSRTSEDGKLGLSSGAAVAIGIGAAVLVGAGVFYAVATHCGDHEDECP
jgi:hypothetical protein